MPIRRSAKSRNFCRRMEGFTSASIVFRREDINQMSFRGVNRELGHKKRDPQNPKEVPIRPVDMPGNGAHPSAFGLSTQPESRHTESMSRLSKIKKALGL